MASVDVLEQRGRSYAELCGIRLNWDTPLGHGQDGIVWASNRKSAVKALRRQTNYECEVECYKLFQERGVVRLLGFAIPELMGFNNSLMIVEMRIVAPPYLLDFGKAKFEPIEFPSDAMLHWNKEGEETFGQKRWPIVKWLLSTLETDFGIYYYDAKPGNIMFADD